VVGIIFFVLVACLIGFTYLAPKGTLNRPLIDNPVSNDTPATPAHPVSNDPNLYTGSKQDDLTGKTIRDKYGNIYTVLNEFQRDSQYFTEGLSWIAPGRLVESSGFWNTAAIHYLDINREAKTINRSEDGFSQKGSFFGEGSDVFPSSDGTQKLFQLTWNSRKIFQYDMNLTKLERTIPMDAGIPAGWAMTHDWNQPNIAYIDTGNDMIYVADSRQDFKLVDKFQITEPVSDTNSKRRGIREVNEIEFIDGSLYMNRWMSNDIYKVDPKTGYVLNKIDFGALHERSLHLNKKRLGRGFDNDDVFNGIAYDRERKTWYVTGKNWQKIYEIRLDQEMQFVNP